MRARLAEHGYLLLRGFHPREKVLAGRMDLLTHLATRDAARLGAPPLLRPGAPLAAGEWGGGAAHPCGHQDWPD